MCLSWFKSYLYKKKKVTNVNGVLGQEYGVVGLNLFILYLNSLCHINRKPNFTLIK